MSFFRRSADCAFIVTLATLSCGLAARAQVGVTQPAPVAAVGVRPTAAVAGVKTAPVTGATAVTTKPVPGVAPVKTTSANGVAAVGALGGVKASGVNTGSLLLLGQIADGQMTMDEAWNKGLLDAPKVLQLLSQTQRLTEDERNETLQRDLAALLVKLAPESVATPETLSARVRIALCRYYSSIGDARAVPLCEALITEKLDGKQINQPLASNPDGGSSSLYLSSVILLAQYYEKVEQWQKAGETWEQALNYWQDVDWFQSGVRIDAARVYSTAGQYQQSEKMYAEAACSSFGTFASGAVIEWLSAEVAHDPHNAKTHLLKIEKEALSVDGKLAARFLLAKLSYQSKDWSGFLQRAQRVNEEYDRSEKSRRSWFFDLAIEMEDLEKWAKLWQKQDLVLEKSELQIALASPLQQSLERRIFVDTAAPTELKVAVEGDRDRIDVRVEPSPWSSDIEEVRHQQIVVVVIKPGTAPVKASIQISSAAQPAKAQTLNVEVTRLATANITIQGET